MVKRGQLNVPVIGIVLAAIILGAMLGGEIRPRLVKAADRVLQRRQT
jgi:hypothetical protein